MGYRRLHWLFLGVGVPLLSWASLEDQILQGTASVDTEVPELSPGVDAETLSRSDEAREDERTRDQTAEKARELEEALRGPPSIPFSAIVVAQRRFIRKAGGFELTPLWVGLQPTDSFRLQSQFGASLIYHFSEQFGLEIGQLYWTQSRRSGLDKTIQKATGLEVDTGKDPVVSWSSALQWTPLRAKAAGIVSLVHFESYITAGGGWSWMSSGVDPMAHVGLGVRLYPSRRLALKFEVRSVSDFGASTQQRFHLWSGASWLLGGGK